jgi:hypothetical protein
MCDEATHPRQRLGIGLPLKFPDHRVLGAGARPHVSGARFEALLGHNRALLGCVRAVWGAMGYCIELVVCTPEQFLQFVGVARVL